MHFHINFIVIEHLQIYNVLLLDSHVPESTQFSSGVIPRLQVMTFSLPETRGMI